MRSNHWRCGYAYEAARAAIEYAFNKLRATGLIAGHNQKNGVSRYILEKLGFHYPHDEYYPPTGLNHPSYSQKAERYGFNDGT